MAEIKKWESKEEYDEALKEIKHYQIHPEMLPYVGEKYQTGKSVLLVGESHYIEDANNIQENQREYYNKFWYQRRFSGTFPNEEWFTTRKVIHRFLVLQRSRAHSMFRNPANAMKEAWLTDDFVTDSDVFETCSFMNYFQRPASNFGATIDNKDQDNQVAYETLCEVTKVISPGLVIFLSKKAYDAYAEYSKFDKAMCKINCDRVYWVCHPTCPHWYEKNGKEKFIEFITDFKHNLESVSYHKYSREDIEKQIEESYGENKIKHFEENGEVLFQLYHKSDYINEIVARTILNGKKVGVGYRVDYRFIWVWNYDDSKYINLATADNEIKKFYDQFEVFIKKLRKYD